MPDEQSAAAPEVLELSAEELERDRARRLQRGIGCTAVMLRVYAGKHPRIKQESKKRRSET